MVKQCIILTNLALHRYVCLITLHLQGVQWFILGKEIKSKALRDEAGRFSIQFLLYSANFLGRVSKSVLFLFIRLQYYNLLMTVVYVPYPDSVPYNPILCILHSLPNFLPLLALVLHIFATCFLFFFTAIYQIFTEKFNLKNLNRSTLIKDFIFFNKSSAQLGHIQCSIKSIQSFIFARLIVSWFSATFAELFSLTSVEQHPLCQLKICPIICLLFYTGYLSS